MFEEGGLYWIGFGNAILGLVLAILFFLLWKFGGLDKTIVLTDKRVKVFFSKKSLFVGKINFEKSVLLKHITSVEMTKRDASKLCNVCVYSANGNISIPVISEEFYELLINVL